MCTVTFLASAGNVFITSSRDENIARKIAVPPALISNNDGLLLCPIDAEKGGTWIAVDDRGNACVLLNGAGKPHLRHSFHKQSRGFVIPYVLQQTSPLAGFQNYDCSATEPFTLVLFSSNILYECRWNGIQKSVKIFNNKSGIWSSSTLYTSEAINNRKHWFNNWRNGYSEPSQNDILNFHRDAGDGDKANAVLMQRSNGMQTVSVTSIAMNSDSTKMVYYDLLNQASYVEYCSRLQPIL